MSTDLQADWAIAAARMTRAAERSEPVEGFSSAAEMAEAFGIDTAAVERKAAALRLLVSPRSA
ncbi:hypothetical protein ABZ897_42870 [Nonomuraea sp. NPDC046802]|uniref:hypothetical protein n=1 Tax=Nonomuraea sp. NPDC046802 TaxID=3154919 RepID=UPI0033DE7D86